MKAPFSQRESSYETWRPVDEANITTPFESCDRSLAKSGHIGTALAALDAASGMAGIHEEQYLGLDRAQVLADRDAVERGRRQFILNEARIGRKKMEAALRIGHAMAGHEDQRVVVRAGLLAQARQFDLDLVLARLVVEEKNRFNVLEEKSFLRIEGRCEIGGVFAA